MPFVSEICMMLGSRFLRKLGLLALICTTSHAFKVRMFCKKVVRPKPDQPDCLLRPCCAFCLLVCSIVYTCINLANVVDGSG